MHAAHTLRLAEIARRGFGTPEEQKVRVSLKTSIVVRPTRRHAVFAYVEPGASFEQLPFELLGNTATMNALDAATRTYVNRLKASAPLTAGFSKGRTQLGIFYLTRSKAHAERMRAKLANLLDPWLS